MRTFAHQPAVSPRTPSPAAPNGRTLASADRAVVSGPAWQDALGDQAVLRRLGVQGTLRVNPPGDRYEQEAERVSRDVVRGHAAEMSAAPPRIQRLAREPDGLPSDRAEGSSPTTTPALPARAEAAVRALEGGGEPLAPALRAYFEPRFGHSFERVRIHRDSGAARSAGELDALAYTRGPHIVFGAGQFEPHTERGQRLLAHELTHVVQQGWAGEARIQRAYVVEVPNATVHQDVPAPPVAVREADEALDVQRQPRTGDAPQGGPAPAPAAAPSLTLTPGAAITRGDTLTATVSFTPAAGETLRVTGWQYTTAAGETVTRPPKDAKFQQEWKGVMALSGTIALSYTLKPRRGAASAGTPVTAAVTVKDRTGAAWQTTITDAPETTLAGMPSPPELAEQLGHHVVPQDVAPAAADTPITGGPNAGFTFVNQVTDRNYKSEPQIHPDVTNPASRFRVFHRDAGRLFFAPTGAARVLIPPAEYQNLKVANGRITFDVPDWTAFYKRHGFWRITLTAGKTSVVAQNGWWRLDPNTANGAVRITNEGAVRYALGIGAKDPYNVAVAANGGWEAIALMPSSQIPPATRSHEYTHARHSHRANFRAIARALDPRRVLESTVSTPANPVVFRDRISFLLSEIQQPNHELVDEAASRAAGRFVAVAGATMAAINEDPASRASLGTLWDITHDRPLG